MRDGGSTSPEEEDRRRIPRERKRLITERVQLVNRIQGLLATQGVSSYGPLRLDRRRRLDDIVTGDGHPLPAKLKAEIGRMLGRLELVLAQIAEVEEERDALLQTSAETPPAPALLARLKAIGPEIAVTLWTEGLYRNFSNRRQVGAFAGLTPSPFSKRRNGARSGHLEIRQ